MSNYSTTGITSDKPGFLREVAPNYPCRPDHVLLGLIQHSLFTHIFETEVGSERKLCQLVDPDIWDPIPRFEKGRLGEIISDLAEAHELPLRRVSGYNVRPATYEILEN